MVSNKDNEMHVIFLGRTISMGKIKIVGNDYYFSDYASLAGGFRKIFRSSEFFENKYVDLDKYEVGTGRKRKEKIRVYLFDIEYFADFSFTEAAPQDLIMKVTSLKEENNILRNRMSEIQKLLSSDQIEEIQSKNTQNILEKAREFTKSYSSAPPVPSHPQSQNTQSSNRS